MQLIRESTYRSTMEETVLPYLASIRQEGVLLSFDGAPLQWYAFVPSQPRCNVVILHGFTESAYKFAEMIWYLVQQGAGVYVMDQRGHGRSFRHVPDPTLTHVEHFEDYVKDAECFVEQVVPRDLPLRLYAHSMGGAVAVLYLEKHPEVFPKAVLSSPMIAPCRNGYPLWLSKLLCDVFILAGKARERIFLSGEYPGEEPFETSCSTSRERFAFYESYRRQNPTHQNYSPTYRWTLESLKVTARILKKGEPEKVTGQVLLCTALADDVVINAEQEKLAARLPHCLHRCYEAKHEIYHSTDDVMESYLEDVLAFLE